MPEKTSNNRGLFSRFTRSIQQKVIWHTTDVFILSYPKCGRTWLRMLLGQALSRYLSLAPADPMDLYRLTATARTVPRIFVSHDDHPSAKRPNEIETNKQRYANKKVIFLVRDPRDTIVSNYFHNAFRKGKFKGTLPQYIEKEAGGLASLLKYYNVWADQRHIPRDFILVRYEDLHTNGVDVLTQIFAFLGLSAPDHDIFEEAVNASKFETMRSIEENAEIDHKRIVPTRSDDERSFKTREGKVGSFQKYLGAEEQRIVEAMIASQLDPFYKEYR